MPGATVITDEVGHCVSFYATPKHCSFCYWTSRLEKISILERTCFFSFSGTICLINFCFSNEAIFAVPCKPIGSGPNVETRSKQGNHHCTTTQTRLFLGPSSLEATAFWRRSLGTLNDGEGSVLLDSMSVLLNGCFQK